MGLLLKLREGGQGPLLVVPSSPAFSDTEYLKGVRGTAVATRAKKSLLLVGTQISDLGHVSGDILYGPRRWPTSGSDFLSSEFRAPSLPPRVALGPAGSSYFRQESLAAGAWKLALNSFRLLLSARSPRPGPQVGRRLLGLSRGRSLWPSPWSAEDREVRQKHPGRQRQWPQASPSPPWPGAGPGLPAPDPAPPASPAPGPSHQPCGVTAFHLRDVAVPWLRPLGTMEFAELIKTPRVDNVVLHRPFYPAVEGTLCLTGHHLILSSRQDNTEELWLLHSNIDAIDKRWVLIPPLPPPPIPLGIWGP